VAGFQRAQVGQGALTITRRTFTLLTCQTTSQQTSPIAIRKIEPPAVRVRHRRGVMLPIQDFMRARGSRAPWHLGMPCRLEISQMLGDLGPEQAASKDWHLGMPG